MSKKHGLLMMGGCVIMMAAAAAVLFFKVPVNNVFIVLMLLLCPLSHFLMMGMMSHGKEETQENCHSAEKMVITSPKELGKG
jgi:hypothetical protein